MNELFAKLKRTEYNNSADDTVKNLGFLEKASANELAARGL